MLQRLNDKFLLDWIISNLNTHRFVCEILMRASWPLFNFNPLIKRAIHFRCVQTKRIAPLSVYAQATEYHHHFHFLPLTITTFYKPENA